MLKAKNRIAKTNKNEICLVCIPQEIGNVQFQKSCNTCIEIFFRENGFLEKASKNKSILIFDQFKYIHTKYVEQDLVNTNNDQEFKFIHARNLDNDHIKYAITQKILNTVGIHLEIAIHAYLVIKIGLRPGFK